jgi:hypothetical protein
MGPGTGVTAPGCEACATATSAEPAANVLLLRIILKYATEKDSNSVEQEDESVL